VCVCLFCFLFSVCLFFFLVFDYWYWFCEMGYWVFCVLVFLYWVCCFVLCFGFSCWFFGCFWDFSQFVKVFLLLKMLYESRILINWSRLWLLSVGFKSTKCWFFEFLLLSITGGSE
jgi:hypothetical protein